MSVSLTLLIKLRNKMIVRITVHSINFKLLTVSEVLVLILPYYHHY
jgi:hypothetical protein